MTTAVDVLRDSFGRIAEEVHAALDGLNDEELRWRPDEGANTIAWLVWHLSRVEDDHVSEVAGTPQVAASSGWSARLALPFDDADTGWEHSPAQVAQVVAGADLLLGYYDAVHDTTATYLATLSDADLDRIVDERWDPPVTLAVRLVSVLADSLQHAGQAAYLRGVILRSR